MAVHFSRFISKNTKTNQKKKQAKELLWAFSVHSAVSCLVKSGHLPTASCSLRALHLPPVSNTSSFCLVGHHLRTCQLKLESRS